MEDDRPDEASPPDVAAYLLGTGWRKEEQADEIGKYDPAYEGWVHPVYDTRHTFPQAASMQLLDDVERLGGLPSFRRLVDRAVEVWGDIEF